MNERYVRGSRGVEEHTAFRDYVQLSMVKATKEKCVKA